MITTNKSIVKRQFGFAELLTSNTKLLKGSKAYSVRGVALAPAKTSGRNTCPQAGNCADVCVLWFSGRTHSESVRQAMIARTNLFFDDRPTFYRLLDASLAKHRRRCSREGTLRNWQPFAVCWNRVTPTLVRDYPAELRDC